MYHFIGIKGTGMSALAQILDDLGYEVQGSDKPDHFFTEAPLIERGIKILGFDEKGELTNYGGLLQPSLGQIVRGTKPS